MLIGTISEKKQLLAMPHNSHNMLKKVDDIFSGTQIVMNDILDNFIYQKELTPQLDTKVDKFSEVVVLRIALWKLNRYPHVQKGCLKKINALRSAYSRALAQEILLELLNSKGVDLPMASAILRFALPKRFQIIDQRVYRLITKGQSRLRIPRHIEDKVQFYFEYLHILKEVCKKYKIPFEKSDRILYVLDKTYNKYIPISGY